jgi:two-component system, chemotaxis family, sensor kinase CheA
MDKDPYRYFRIEARELLDELGRGALDLARPGNKREAILRLLRNAHTLKGAARVVKQAPIADLSHQIEDVLQPHREATDAVPSEVVDGVLKRVDGIAAQLAVLDAPAPALAPVADKEAAPASTPTLPTPETVRVELREMDALQHGVSESSALVASLHKEAAALDDLRRAAITMADQLATRDYSDLFRARMRSSAEELVTRLVRSERSIENGLEQLGIELQQVRDAADRLRLLPVDSAFASLERAVRDAAHALGKEVAFRAIGEDARLDAHVLDALRGALLHTVRNAVAHGVESPAARRAAGKSPQGLVSIRVVRTASALIFSCSDDGAGVDLEAVRAAALRAGRSDARSLDEDGLLALLLRGGLSTTDHVDEISGRGVGLDAVRATATQLGGNARLRSQRGKGATLEITVPFSLAAARVLSAESDSVIIALPLDSIRRTLRVAVSDVARTADQESIVDRGEVIPVISLRRVLGTDSTLAASRSHFSAMVVHTSAGTVALGVDRLLGAAELVARPLPPLAKATAIVSGAAIDAEGNPRLVLDPVGLVQAALALRPRPVVATTPQLPILIVDDSLTTRMLEQAILESAGYKVDLATSAEEALEKLPRRRYGLLLVDVEMPGMNGFELVARLQQDPATRDIPAVMVTSRGSDEDRQRATAAGARAHVLKGEFDQGKLLAIIRQWMT